MGQPRIAVGAQIEIEDGSGYRKIDGVKSVNFPGFNIASVETTSLDNSDFAQTFMAGLIDPGTITADITYTDETYQWLAGLIRETFGVRVTGAPDPETGDTTVNECDGFIVKLDVNKNTPDETMISLELKLSGLPQVSEGGGE